MRSNNISSTRYVPVTGNDATDLPDGACTQLMVSVGGTLKVNDVNGVTRSLTVPAGVLPIAVLRVWATGTAATGITALY